MAFCTSLSLGEAIPKDLTVPFLWVLEALKRNEPSAIDIPSDFIQFKVNPSSVSEVVPGVMLPALLLIRL
jgi:hypothetical protein